MNHQTNAPAIRTKPAFDSQLVLRVGPEAAVIID